ncbi:hypothetical protein SDC9_183769 [bioreactor metagenome]|uniref:Uncharacterized protein n=1 Tax=bioreactor metagenome TaxID=1076179 RepID=A0A645HC18_9ZZZZ
MRDPARFNVPFKEYYAGKLFDNIKLLLVNIQLLIGHFYVCDIRKDRNYLFGLLFTGNVIHAETNPSRAAVIHFQS